MNIIVVQIELIIQGMIFELYLHKIINERTSQYFNAFVITDKLINRNRERSITVSPIIVTYHHNYSIH